MGKDLLERCQKVVKRAALRLRACGPYAGRKEVSQKMLSAGAFRTAYMLKLVSRH
jgi:hypothetical protein